MMKRAPIVVLAIVGCGSNNAKPPDARPIDAPAIDAPGPDGAVQGTHYHYVIDSETVPTTSTIGLDLDGDGIVDNHLGGLYGTLLSVGNVDVQTPVTTEIDDGLQITLIDLQTTSLATATGAGVAIYEGDDPVPAACAGDTDTTCRHQLTGSGSFGVVANTNPALVGDFVGGVLTAGPGDLVLAL